MRSSKGILKADRSLALYFARQRKDGNQSLWVGVFQKVSLVGGQLNGPDLTAPPYFELAAKLLRYESEEL